MIKVREIRYNFEEIMSFISHFLYHSWIILFLLMKSNLNNARCHFFETLNDKWNSINLVSDISWKFGQNTIVHFGMRIIIILLFDSAMRKGLSWSFKPLLIIIQLANLANMPSIMRSICSIFINLQVRLQLLGIEYAADNK